MGLVWMAAASSRVAVAVLTFRRPADLAAVVPELLGHVDELPGPATVLVVDNSPEAGAREQVAAFGDPRVRYVHEPVPGIAAARNRAIDESAAADLLVFIDDDERPVEGWLRALVETYQRTGASGVVGPVVSTFSGDLDPWVRAGGFFERRQLPTGTEVAVAATNNLLLDVRHVRDRGLRFDERLGLVGGSDNLFTHQLTRGGGRLVWCAEATVVDVVPPERMTRRWVLTRAFRLGNGTSLVQVQLAGSARQRAVVRLRQVLLGGSRLGGGMARILLGALGGSLTQRAGGSRNCARGLGLITGAFGWVYAEYRREASGGQVGGERVQRIGRT